jgi:hypothetical protein
MNLQSRDIFPLAAEVKVSLCPSEIVPLRQTVCTSTLPPMSYNKKSLFFAQDSVFLFTAEICLKMSCRRSSWCSDESYFACPVPNYTLKMPVALSSTQRPRTLYLISKN